MWAECTLAAVLLAAVTVAGPQPDSSSFQPGFGPAGAVDGDRFRCDAGHVWRGVLDATGSGWWQVRFAQPQQVGSILQVHGDDPDVLANAPRSYVWQWSDDGTVWHDLPETAIANETRSFRIHRLHRSISARLLRLSVRASGGEYAALREVEVYPESNSSIAFPDWALSVNITDRAGSRDGFGHITVARRTDAGAGLLAQHVDARIVSPDFIAVEPHPLCMFLSGSYKDWCEVDRAVYRGIEQVVKKRQLPTWGSCGGCQLLAILEETGVDRPWDCPHCRDPLAPRLPIYTHIHCTDKTNSQTACGDYGACEFERGPMLLVRVQDDPVFSGLPANGEFTCQESHCGQIAYLPRQWIRLATHGPAGKTVNQLMKVKGYPIYAAQFHIDMGGPHAEILAANFLNIARQWQRERR